RTRTRRIEAAKNRLRLHRHAAAAAEGRIVRRAVPVVGVCANVPHPHGEQAALSGPPHDALLEGSEHLGKERQDIDLQIAFRPLQIPAGGSTTISPASVSMRSTT